MSYYYCLDVHLTFQKSSEFWTLILEIFCKITDLSYYLFRHPDTQHNDTQHNDTQYNGAQYNNTQHNDTQHNI
jgi:hypothetical protein